MSFASPFLMDRLHCYPVSVHRDYTHTLCVCSNQIPPVMSRLSIMFHSEIQYVAMLEARYPRNVSPGL